MSLTIFRFYFTGEFSRKFMEFVRKVFVKIALKTRNFGILTGL